MATITLEKDLLRKVSRLGLDVSKKPRISVFNDEEIVSVVNFLLSRYDAAWFWETENFSLQENRKRCLRYLRLLDIAHLISGPTDFTPGNKRILRLLCALFEKLERKHGSTLYQKPRQVLKPRPRRSPVTPQDAGGNFGQSEKENHSRTRPTSQRKRSVPSSSSNIGSHAASQLSGGSLPRSPPQSQRNVATPMLRQAAAAPTVAPTSVDSLAPPDDSPIPVSAPHSSYFAGHFATGEPTPSELPSGGRVMSPAATHQILPSTELMQTLQAQINDLQSNIAKTSHQHDSLRLQQSRLSDNLQRMWAHYEFNLRLLRDLSRTDSQSAHGFLLKSLPPGVSSSEAPLSTANVADPAHTNASKYMKSLQRAVSVERLDVPPRQGCGHSGRPKGGAESLPVVYHLDHTSSAAAGDLPSHETCGSPSRRPQQSSEAAGLFLAARSPGLGGHTCEVSGQPDGSLQSAGPEPPPPTSCGDHRNTVPPFTPPDPSTALATPVPVADLDTLTSDALVPAQPGIDYLERRLQRVLRRSELFLERDRLMQARITSLELH